MGPLRAADPELWRSFRLPGVSSGRAWLPADLFLRLLAALLVGYAVGGRAFAYLGWGSLYVGEAVLAIGLVTALPTLTRVRIPRSAPLAWLAVFGLWGLGRTLPGIERHGLDAARDAVVWGYSAFAFLMAGVLLARPDRLLWLLHLYRRFALSYPLVMLPLWVSLVVYGDLIPPVIREIELSPKGGDTLVLLAGISSFCLLGFARPRVGVLLCLCSLVLLCAISNRGGTLSLLAALSVASLATSARARLAPAVGVLAFAATIVFGLGDLLQRGAREVSLDQLSSNISSVFSPQERQELDGSRRWRLDWWGRIVDYTIYGPYFWEGRGFGPNLATTDGFDLDKERTLRSPHNVHMTFLARGGVPGLLLWLALQLSWLISMLAAYRRSSRSGQDVWARLFLFLIAYWLSFQVNGTFDVYLEGPMGGIWFWTVLGVGLASAQLYRTTPELLYEGARLPAGGV